MTSGEFRTVPISSITVNREERQRRVLDDNHIASLADSIAKRGLIHPPVIDRQGVLVVGECRVAAACSLGWTSISVQYIDELDPIALRAVELEENVRRKNLEWREECLAVKEYHDLRRAEEPEWRVDSTGEELGFSRDAIEDRLNVAKELLSGNARVTEAPKFSTAKGIIRRANERAAGAASVALTEAFGAVPKEPESILTADFREWAKTYSGPKFNFIHCDFPYGIGADKFVQGAAATHGGYDDSRDLYFDLLDCLLDNLDRLGDESCHIMFWFSMHYYGETLARFGSKSNFVVDRFPLIWLKSDNIGIIPDPERGPRRIYETAFFGSRGDRKIVRSASNAIAHSSERSDHMSVKPQAMLQHFFKMFVDESTVFLDPTCGLGSSVRAARELAARSYLGLEVNETFADRARLQMKIVGQAK